MAKGNLGTIIIMSILSIAGLGLSGYMFTTDLLEESDEDVYGNLKLVALWDALARNKETPPYNSNDNFLVEFYDQELLDSDYVYVVNETRFTLLNDGLYKISLNTLFTGTNALNQIFLMGLKQNETIIGLYGRHQPESIIDYSYYATGSIYVNSTGGNDTYYEIRGYIDMAIAKFSVILTQVINQLSIEYVVL